MAHQTTKYTQDIPRYEGCDCPMPSVSWTENKALGMVTTTRLCCQAVKMSGGTPTLDGVEVTDFVNFWTYTHWKEVRGPRNELITSEHVVADHPWDADETKVVADAVPAVIEEATYEVVTPAKAAVWGLVDDILVEIEPAEDAVLNEVTPAFESEPAKAQVTKKKGEPPPWLWKLLAAKKHPDGTSFYKAMP